MKGSNNLITMPSQFMSETLLTDGEAASMAGRRLL